MNTAMTITSPNRSTPTLPCEIADRMSFDTLRYAMVWEDIDLLYRGLQITPDDDVLSITSAGDNVLGLLLKNPRSITAIDLNPCQNALLELKLAAIQVLSYDDFLTLLGVRPGTDPLDLYAACLPLLPPYARHYWDANTAVLTQGIIRQGRLERYIRGWQEAVLHKVLTPAEVTSCFARNDPQAQGSLFEQVFDNTPMQQAFQWYFGTHMMARHGRDAAQFAYVEIDAGMYFYQRFKYAFTHLPLRENFYLAYFMTGDFLDLEHVHPYLQRANFDLLKARVDRIQVVTASMESFLSSCADRTFSKANLSNMMEYLSPAHFATLLTQLHRVFRKGGRLAYWSLLVDRTRPAALNHRYRSHTNLAHQLWRQDRSWFYRSFHLEEVVS